MGADLGQGRPIGAGMTDVANAACIYCGRTGATAEVVITAPDPGWLKDFSRTLIERRLCASAHNFAPVRSIYRWRGEICEPVPIRCPVCPVYR
jgi:hypothetical protein